MILKDDILRAELERNEKSRLRIIPTPDLNSLGNNGQASVDIRLGRWFVTMRQARVSLLRMSSKGQPDTTIGQCKQQFVQFGKPFILHPSKFVLGITLEWICLPAYLAGYVTGKSSWARRGLIIETAAGIHPGFSGCIALEMTNIGEIPIEIVPGSKICQLFIHRTEGNDNVQKSQYGCQRKPIVGEIKSDMILESLKNPI